MVDLHQDFAQGKPAVKTAATVIYGGIFTYGQNDSFLLPILVKFLSHVLKRKSKSLSTADTVGMENAIDIISDFACKMKNSSASSMDARICTGIFAAVIAVSDKHNLEFIHNHAESITHSRIFSVFKDDNDRANMARFLQAICSFWVSLLQSPTQGHPETVTGEPIKYGLKKLGSRNQAIRDWITFVLDKKGSFTGRVLILLGELRILG